MKTYAGIADGTGGVVHIVQNGGSRELPLRLDLVNHSPTGFAWGYGGSGPAQLALAIIADATGDDALAVQHHQRFKFKVIGRLEQTKDWSMTHTAVMEALRDLTATAERGAK